MLVIRDTQIDAFRRMLRLRFEDELTDIVMATYPGACRQKTHRGTTLAQRAQLAARRIQRAVENAPRGNAKQ